MSIELKDKPPREDGPAWEIARLFPHQGHWSEIDYLDLAHRTNNLVELANGRVEVLPMPTKSHQLIVLHLYSLLAAHLRTNNAGQVLVAAYPVRLEAEKFREPDLVVALTPYLEKLGEDFAHGADLVIEVVSSDRRKDFEIKRVEYARAGIPEYWIIDPRDQKILVLTLEGDTYTCHGEFAPGQRAASRLLAGFEADVNAVFEAGRGRA
jgi:Uma2 family endonuclease